MDPLTAVAPRAHVWQCDAMSRDAHEAWAFAAGGGPRRAYPT
jgi:hypothetical protein